MSMIHHTSIGVSNFKKAMDFYDAVLGALGFERVMTMAEYSAAAYGEAGGAPAFWIGVPQTGKPSPGLGVHFGFNAASKEAVQAFYDTALKLGAKDNGAPGPRPHYSEGYYGGFVIDPDGNKLEAVCFG